MCHHIKHSPSLLRLSTVMFLAISNNDLFLQFVMLKYAVSLLSITQLLFKVLSDFHVWTLINENFVIILYIE